MREDQFVSVFGLSSCHTSTTIHRIHFVYLLESTLWRPKYLLWAFHFLEWVFNCMRPMIVKFEKFTS